MNKENIGTDEVIELYFVLFVGGSFVTKIRKSIFPICCCFVLKGDPQ